MWTQQDAGQTPPGIFPPLFHFHHSPCFGLAHSDWLLSHSGHQTLAALALHIKAVLGRKS